MTKLINEHISEGPGITFQLHRTKNQLKPIKKMLAYIVGKKRTIWRVKKDLQVSNNQQL